MSLISIAVVFFVIAIVAYAVGAKGLAGMSVEIGRTLLFVFLVLAIILFSGGVSASRIGLTLTI
jgi:uncharacterized membrane protein YtjA (UPF0391 family)